MHGLRRISIKLSVGWRIGDHVVNLREDILIHRIKYSLMNMDENSKDELVSLAPLPFQHLNMITHAQHYLLSLGKPSRRLRSSMCYCLRSGHLSLLTTPSSASS